MLSSFRDQQTVSQAHPKALTWAHVASRNLPSIRYQKVWPRTASGLVAANIGRTYCPSSFTPIENTLREIVMDELATVKLFYSLLASGNNSAALRLLDPEIEWTEAEGTPYFAGTMHGPEAVIAGLFAPLARDFDNFTTTPSDFLAEGPRVVSFGRYFGISKENGRAKSAPFVHLWTVFENRLRRFVQFTDSAPWKQALT
jgi:ketosteroid isomerase-like protein